jgi:hypothetical protein
MNKAREVKYINPKVYVATDGRYSDYSIRGVFASASDAEEFMKAYGSQYAEWNEIEEYEVGANLDRVRGGDYPYEAWIRISDGSIRSIGRKDMPHDHDTAKIMNMAYNDPDWVRCEMWAKTDVEAIKIAAELRQERLRTQVEA